MDTFREVLRQIVDRSGEEILEDKNRLIAHLADMGAGCRKEIRIFRKNCGKELIWIFCRANGLSKKERQAAMRRARYQLREEEGLAKEWADMIAEALAYALGWEDIQADSPLPVQLPVPCSRQEEDKEIRKDKGGEIADTWEGIFAAIRDRTYQRSYRIGDMKPLDLGKEGCVHMQIAAFDTDELADGSGKASITWISRELLKTEHRMNPLYAVRKNGNGSGASGGWKSSEMRRYMQDSVLPLIPQDVRSQIKTVIKKQQAVDGAWNAFLQSTEDTVWIPDASEIFGKEDMRCSSVLNMRKEAAYKDLFPDEISRVKKMTDGKAADWWWLRTSDYYIIFYAVGADGASASYAAYSTGAVPLCFCT